MNPQYLLEVLEFPTSLQVVRFDVVPALVQLVVALVLLVRASHVLRLGNGFGWCMSDRRFSSIKLDS